MKFLPFLFVGFEPEYYLTRRYDFSAGPCSGYNIVLQVINFNPYLYKFYSSFKIC